MERQLKIGRYWFFDCDECAGKVTLHPSNSQEKTAALAAMYLGLHDYQAALETIKHANVYHNKFPNELCRSILQQIIKIRNNHPKALAVKDFALCWLVAMGEGRDLGEKVAKHLKKVVRLKNHISQFISTSWSNVLIDNSKQQPIPSLEIETLSGMHFQGKMDLSFYATRYEGYRDYIEKCQSRSPGLSLEHNLNKVMRMMASNSIHFVPPHEENFLIYIHIIRHGTEQEINEIKTILLLKCLLGQLIGAELIFYELAERRERLQKAKQVQNKASDGWEIHELLQNDDLDDFLNRDSEMVFFPFESSALEHEEIEMEAQDGAFDILNLQSLNREMFLEIEQHNATLLQKYKNLDVFELLYGTKTHVIQIGERFSFPPIPKLAEKAMIYPLHFSKLAQRASISEIEGKIYEKIHSPAECDMEMQICQMFTSWCKERASKTREPIIAKQFRALTEGAVCYDTELKAARVCDDLILTAKPSILAVAMQRYESVLAEKRLELRALEDSILTQANDYRGNILPALHLAREEQSELDMQTLLVALATRRHWILKQNNPVLSDSEAQSLFCQVGQYALLLWEIQRLDRCRMKLAEYAEASAKETPKDTLKHLSDEYRCMSTAECRYNPEQNPLLLVFEIFSDLIIRNEQIEALDQWIRNPGHLFELGTNQGKSKVIAPLFMMMADAQNSDTVMINIIPTVLYEAQMAHMQSIFKKANDYFAYCVEFNRDSPCSVGTIKQIRNTFDQARLEKRPIFMSDSSAHNLFVLKLKELFQAGYSDDGFATLLELLKLRKFIKKYARALIEEPHLILDDSQESNYSIGMPRSFNPMHLNLCTDLYKAFLSLIQDKWYVDFWNESNAVPQDTMELEISESTHLSPLTSEIYRAEVLPLLLKEMMQKFNFNADTQVLTYGDNAVSANLTRTQLTWSMIMKYLEGSMSFDEQRKFELLLGASVDDLKKTTPQLVIRILHDQLHHFLPQTIGRNVGEHYALTDDAMRMAQPLENARQAKKGAEYVSPDQVINFTIQANLKIDFTKNDVLAYLGELSNEVSEELENSKETFFNTYAYKKWQSLTSKMDLRPKNPFKMNSDEMSCFIDYINHNHEGRLKFIETSILPKLHSFNEKAVSSPHLLVHCFNSIHGSSGTLSMQNLPHSLLVHTDVKWAIKTLFSLLKCHMQKDHNNIFEVSGKHSRDILSTFGKQFPQATVAIEIGAVFRDYQDLFQLATDGLAALPHIEGVVVFDAEGEPMVLLRGEKFFLPKTGMSVNEDKLLWLYAQKDITGVDQKLPPMAQGVAFINKHTTLTQLLQGVSRMRGLSAQQTIKISVDKDSGIAIRQRLKVSEKHALTVFDIIEYCLIEEWENNATKNLRSLTLQSNALLENHFWEHVLSQIEPDKDVSPPAAFSIRSIWANFQQLRDLLIDNTEDAPLLRPSLSLETIAIERALEHMSKEFERKVCALLTRFKTLSSAIFAGQDLHAHFAECDFLAGQKAIQNRMEYSKETKLFCDAAATQVTETTAEQIHQSTGIQQNVQQQDAEASAEQETQAMEYARELTNAAQLGRRAPLKHQGIEYYPLANYFIHKDLNKFLPLFAGSPLQITLNAISTLAGDTMAAPGWVNGYVKQLSYLAEIEGVFVLMDPNEGAKLFEGKKIKLWLINHGPLYAMSDEELHGIQNDAMFQSMELSAKLLNADLDFCPRQWDFLQKWLNGDQARAALLKDFIQQVLLPLNPALQTCTAYQNLTHV